METFTSVVSRGGNDENTAVSAQLNSIIKKWMCLAGRSELAAANVNYMGSMLNGLRDGTREVNLRTGGKRTAGAIREHGDDESATTWRYATYGPTVLPKDYAGNVCSVR